MWSFHIYKYVYCNDCHGARLFQNRTFAEVIAEVTRLVDIAELENTLENCINL